MDLLKTGRLIAELRREKGLTQKAVAEKLGICAKTISKWETGHGFPDVILIPYTEIEEKAKEVLSDKAKLILVYCRSGRRSKIASESLVMLGYTNVKEFGGINDWPYEMISK